MKLLQRVIGSIIVGGESGGAPIDKGTFTLGEDVVLGERVYIGSDEKAYLTDATDVAKSTGLIGVAMESGSADDDIEVLFDGTIAASGLTAGEVYYLDPAVPGGITTSPPTGSGTIGRVVGQAKTATSFRHSVDATWWLNDGGVVDINNQTDDYTIVFQDLGRVVEMEKASLVTLTIPTDANMPAAAGVSFDVVQAGEGGVAIAGEVGVTLRGDLGVPGQWRGVTCLKRGANDWLVFGGV